MEELYKVKTLGKALRVLECFNVHTPELGITDISRRLKLQKSNVHDIISTFEQAGYIQQNPRNGKYFLTVKMLEYSFVINEYFGYTRMAYDVVDRLAKKVQQITFFAIPQGTDVFYLHSAHPHERPAVFPYRAIAGEKCPMYCSALGKSMLAFGDPGFMKKLENVKKIRFTPNTIMTQEALQKELMKVRKRGYSTDLGEHEYNLGAVAVPVLDRQGKLVAAVSIYSTCEAIEKNIANYAACLKEAAFEIRERL